MAAIPKAAHIILRSLDPVQGSTVEVSVPIGPEGSPTISGGYATWDTVERPFRRGLPVFKGYSPYTMTIPLMFNGYEADQSVEGDIQKLELLAGRTAAGGILRPPPVLRLHSGSHYRDTDSALVPAQYRTLDEGDLTWVLTDIEWDSSPLRRTNGNRLRQLCTVTMLEYVTTSALNIRPAPKAPTTRTVTVKQRDTLRSLARKYLGDAERWREIKRLNNLKSSAIKAGQKLKVPRN